MRKIWTPKIILPPILEEDERLKASATALEGALSDLSYAALECLFLPRLDILPSNILNVLANQYHVDFYDVSMSDEEKRSLIRDAIQWHRRKGTPAAVEEIARKVYGDAHVTEWFEYDGEPYHFRILQDITADDEPADRDTLDRLRAAVRESKNTRSWLDFYGFIVVPEDTVEAYDPTVEINPLIVRNDFYDYRRNPDHYDGRPHYGKYLWFYDGKLRYDGAGSYKGFDAEYDYGRLQATDFERLEYGLTFNWADTAEPDAFNCFTADIKPFDDAFPAPFDDPVAADISFLWRDYETDVKESIESAMTLGAREETIEAEAILQYALDISPHQDTVEPVDTADILAVNINRLDNEPVDEEQFFNPSLSASDGEEVSEEGECGCHQYLRYDGKHTYNGEMPYNGTIFRRFALFDEELNRRWQQKFLAYSATFDEPCAQCGSRDYQYLKGSVRIGSECFLISDPQILTLRIVCAHCGSLIADILIEEDTWEEII